MRSVSAISNPCTISSRTFFRVGCVVAPHAEMNLHFAWSRQHRGVHIIVAFVNRRDALLDVRFTQPGDAQFAMKKSRARYQTRESRPNRGFEYPAHLPRGTRKQRNDAATLFDPQAGRRAARVVQRFRAFGNHGLANINFRHFSPKTAETALRWHGRCDHRAAVFCPEVPQPFLASGRPPWGRGRRTK